VPSLDVNTTDAFPLSVHEYDLLPGYSYPNLGSPMTLQSMYLEFPFRRFRETTHRNSPVVGGPKIPSPFKLRMLEWYSEKPKIIEFINKRNVRRAFHLAKVDWRKRRPVKGPQDIPKGWELKELPTGKYARFQTGMSPVGKLSIFRNQPLTVQRLRPSLRPWRRQNPNLALNAWVNDLTYWSQDGGLYGTGAIGICNNADNNWTYNPPDGGGTALGAIIVDGHMSPSFFENLGFSSSPFQNPEANPVDPQNLLIEYAEQIDELSYVALKRHYAKLHNQKIDLATETAQAMQTVNMIVDISKRVAKAFLSLKKLNLVGAFQALFPTSRKELANDYLVFQYGIKPLLGDIQGAAEHLADYVLKARPVKSNGHAQKTYQFDVPSVLETTPEHFGYWRYGSKTVHIRVKYGSLFKVSSDLERQAAQLGITNPANVIWELVPFSFVADWFLPIGDFLSSLTSLDGLVLKESYKTVFIEIVENYFEQNGSIESATNQSLLNSFPAYTLTGSPKIQSNGFLFWRGGMNGSYSRTVFCKREVIPLPDVPKPRFKSPISKVHLLEALALFTQLRER